MASARRPHRSNRRRRPFGVGVVAIGALFMLAACSGDDDASSVSTPDVPTVELVNEAVVRIDPGDLPFGDDDRLRELESAAQAMLRSDPTDRDALFTSGTLALARADAGEARAQLETLVDLGSPSREALYNLGVAHLVLGDSGAARTAFESALAIEPDYALAMLQLGYLLIAEGDPVRGVELVIEATELDPTLRADEAGP
jgi:tetratricopeptide (TPR) repeat protein